MCARFQDVSRMKGLDFWIFVRKTGEIRPVALYQVTLSFTIESTLAVEYDWVLALRNQIFE